MDQWNRNITKSVKDITEDLWNTTHRHYEAYSGQTPTWTYDDRVTEWSQYMGIGLSEFDSGTLLPLGLFFGSSYDIEMNKPETWKFKGWLYNGILYPTTEDFRNAYYSGNFTKLPPNVDGQWTSTDQKGPVLPLADEPPPMPIAKRARFSVDLRQKYVEWMAFSFYLSFDYNSGIQFHDLRFKGERVIFELGLQEVIAHYVGSHGFMSNPCRRS